MKDTSWEFYFYETNPSPFERVAFWCVVPLCKLILPYHENVWRRAVYDDHRNYREVGGFNSYCPAHWEHIQSLKKDQEDDQEGEG